MARRAGPVLQLKLGWNLLRPFGKLDGPSEAVLTTVPAQEIAAEKMHESATSPVGISLAGC